MNIIDKRTSSLSQKDTVKNEVKSLRALLNTVVIINLIIHQNKGNTYKINTPVIKNIRLRKAKK